VTPTPGRAGAWETAKARTCRAVAIRWDWRRGGPAPRWVVVAFDGETPSESFARGNLRVLFDATDEDRAREKLASLRAP
jgi:hypothetical protein